MAAHGKVLKFMVGDLCASGHSPMASFSSLGISLRRKHAQTSPLPVRLQGEGTLSLGNPLGSPLLKSAAIPLNLVIITQLLMTLDNCIHFFYLENCFSLFFQVIF